MGKELYQHITQEYYLLKEFLSIYKGDISIYWLNRFTIIQMFFKPTIESDLILHPCYEDDWFEQYQEDLCVPIANSDFENVDFTEWPLIENFRYISISEPNFGNITHYRSELLSIYSETFLWENRIALKELRSAIRMTRSLKMRSN